LLHHHSTPPAEDFADVTTGMRARNTNVPKRQNQKNIRVINKMQEKKGPNDPRNISSHRCS